MSDDNKQTDYYPRQSKWIRGVFIVIILIGYGLAEALLWFLTAIQFFWVIFKAEPNKHIRDFAYKLKSWTSGAISYCLWETNIPPFPLTSWLDEG